MNLEIAERRRRHYEDRAKQCHRYRNDALRQWQAETARRGNRGPEIYLEVKRWIENEEAFLYFAEHFSKLEAGDLSELRSYEFTPIKSTYGERRSQLDALRWRGEPLADKTIFLYGKTFHCEGHGSRILFARWANALRDRGARVIMESRPELDSLFSCLDGVELLDWSDPAPACDFACPLIYLPAEAGATLATIPPTPYLRPTPARLDKWRARLPRGSRRLIALAWSGTPHNRWPSMRERWLSLSQLAPILAEPNCTFVSIRKGMTATELEALERELNILHVGDEFEDFADTAAVLSLCDLCISIDGAPAHLAGALGLPCWVLLKYEPYWCWFEYRDDSPFYSSVRLFRQPFTGCWDDPIERVARELRR